MTLLKSLFMILLFATNVANAANISVDQYIGSLDGQDSKAFSITKNQLTVQASIGDKVQSNWNFDLRNNGGLETQIGVTNLSLVNIDFMKAYLMDSSGIVGALSSSFGNYFTFNAPAALKDGAYSIIAEFGIKNNGNWSVSGTVDTINASPSAVPVPGAVWLFGSSMMAYFGFFGRKKQKQNS